MLEDPKRYRRICSAIAVRNTAVASLFTLLTFTTAHAASQVERSLPATVLAGIPFGVTNTVTAAENVLVYAVEDTVPAGWSVGKIGSGGFVDINHGKIKWGPFFDREPRALTYELIAPENARGEFGLSGTASFNGETVFITGQTSVRVESAAGAGGRDEVVSFLPARFVPGAPLVLTAKVSLSEETIVYSVEDQVPAGWGVGFLNHGGRFDAAASKVKWGPFSDRVARELICELKPPLGVTNSVTLVGVGWFNTRPVLISGQRTTSPVIGTVVSEFPGEYQPGQLVTVTLTVTPSPLTKVFAVEDAPPADWTVGQIGQGGQRDASLGRVKWGPFFTNAVTVLTYEVTPPNRVSGGVVTFVGNGAFDKVSVAITGQRQMTGLVSRVTRLMAAEFVVGAPFTVTNQVVPDRTVIAQAVEDEVLANVSVSALSHEGTFDPSTRRIKWGPFLDNQSRELTYRVTPPSSFTGTLEFRGTGSFNGVQVAITGQEEARAVALSERNSVVRSMSSSVRAARSMLVTNRVIIGTSLALFAVEDRLPIGWTATEISHEGVFDPRAGAVKWGPFFDAVERVLNYRLAAPKNASGRVTLGGTVSFNAELAPILGASNVLAIGNNRPVAREDIFQRSPGQGMTISYASLLANDSDPDGDPLNIIEVAPKSMGGGAVSASGETITYAPPVGPDQADSFSYKIDDTFGGVVEGMVRLEILPQGPSLNRWRIETFPDGTIRLRFAGIPGRTYRVQGTESLKNPNWITLESRVANVLGEFEFHDVNALNYPVRFYRTISP